MAQRGATSPVSLRVTLKGLPELRRALSPPLTEQAEELAVRRLTLVAEREAKRKAPHDTNALRRSIQGTVTRTGGRVRTTKRYARTMEKGRKRGRKPPPANRLRGWAKRHGIPTDKGTLFVLARSIGRRGIRGRFFMRKGKRKAQQKSLGVMRQAGRDVERHFRENAL